MIKYKDFLDSRIDDLSGKTYVVTGASAGLGMETTRFLAYKNATVYMACRNEDKTKKVIEEIKKDIPNAKLYFLKYNQASKESCKNLAREMSKFYVDCLILNAGIYHPTKGLKTDDGYPLTVGTNFVGEYFLINYLSESLNNSMIKRIVFVSSIVRNLGRTKNYKKHILGEMLSISGQYNVSKYLIYLLAVSVKKQYKSLEVVLTHPGIAGTNITKEEHSSIPKVIGNLGVNVMNLFANDPQKSSLSYLEAATYKVGELDYFYPRGFLHLSGYPAMSHIKLSKIKSEAFRLACLDTIKL